MEKKFLKVTTPIILAVLVVVLQVLIVRINFIYEPLAMNIGYGVKTAGLWLAMESLSLLSGAALAWIPDKKPQLEEAQRKMNPGFDPAARLYAPARNSQDADDGFWFMVGRFLVLSFVIQ